MTEPDSIAALLSTAVATLGGAVLYLYRDAKAEASARLTEARAHAARVEELIRASVERDRELSERDDRLEDLLLTLTEIAKQPRTRATTDPKKEKAR